MPAPAFVFATILFVAMIAYPIADRFTLANVKAEIASDENARTRAYRRWIAISAGLAVCALVPFGFDVMRLHLTARPPWLPSPDAVLGAAIGAAIGLVGTSVAAFVLMRRTPEKLRKLLAPIDFLLPRTNEQRRWFALLAINAGITEEIVFRGFALRYLSALPFHWALGTCVLVAAAVFGIAHVYQGIAGVLGTSLLALVFTVVFVYTGNLALPIVLHALFDLRLLLIVPAPRAAISSDARAT